MLVEAEARIPKVARLGGTDGKAKMSKSIGNAIFLSDDVATVTQKIKKMYTDPNHLRVEDPGQVEGNPVFEYLDAFDPNKEKVQELKDHYRRGGLGDAVVKKYLLEVILDFLEPIQKRRAEYEKDPEAVMKILEEGTAKANETASQTLSEVKAAMKLDYFSAPAAASKPPAGPPGDPTAFDYIGSNSELDRIFI